MSRLWVAVSLFFWSVLASAAGLADIAAGIDFTDVTAGIVAIAVAIGGALVIKRGASMILSALGR